ncbi:MAG: sortase [Chloroflexaceae bacterium]
MRFVVMILLALLAGGGLAQPAALIRSAATSSVPVTATPPMTTPAPVRATPAPMMATPVPATATRIPATATRVPATATPAPVIQRAGGPPVRLVIPVIELDRILVPVGLDRKGVPVVPDHDVGWYNLSAAPGQGENVVLWGHVLRFRNTPHIPAPFARLKEVPIGAQLILYSADGTAHTYVVSRQIRATPDQVEYILPTGREQVTLVSCIGDKVIVNGATVDMTHRLITIAEPV